MRGLLIAAVVAALILIGAGARLAWLAGPAPSPGTAEALATDALRRLDAAPTPTMVDLEALFPGGAWLELTDPALMLPQSHTLPFAAWRALSDCAEAAPATLALRKAATWRDFACGLRPDLPAGFFDRGPWMHPSGASYVALAMARGERFDAAFLEAQSGRLHAAELGDAADPARRVLAALDTPALAAVHRGHATALAPEWVLRRRGEHGRRYAAWPRARWAALGAGLPLVSARRGDRCLTRVGDLCWRARDLGPARARWSAVVLVVTLILGAMLLLMVQRWYRDRSAERAARRFVLRTLTHELRTPATALSLSLETLRDQYDALPPAGQDATLALSDGVARLQRTLAASANYLTLRGKPAAERAQRVDIPSINALLIDLLDDHDVVLVPLTHDRALRSDPEWLALCVRNLVDNALRHGQPPVEVALAVVGAELEIRVRDAGETRGLDLRAMTRAFHRADESKGLGLGLALVRDAARTLGGTLTHQGTPTTFCLRVPGVSR